MEKKEKCPDALLPDGPICPKCGQERGPSGINGGSWVHLNTYKEEKIVPDSDLLALFKELNESLNKTIVLLKDIEFHKQIRHHSAWEATVAWELKVQRIQKSVEAILEKHKS